jgi:uncharacterized DUF497 family protein
MCIHCDYYEQAANLKKHGDAALVLYDDRAVTIRADEAGEERYATIGMDPAMRILVVVYTWRGNRPRLISAREATPHERDHYEANA